MTWQSYASILLCAAVLISENPPWRLLLYHHRQKAKNALDIFIKSPTYITFDQYILTWSRYRCVLPTKTRGCDKTPFVQWLLWGRAHRQWRFSSMSHIVTLHCTEGHSQIRSCVPSSLSRRGKACCSEAVWVCVSLCWLRKFSRDGLKKKKHWEKPIFLHNMKLNGLTEWFSLVPNK